MTYKHECNNCRWALRKYTGPVCTNSKSGRKNVNERDWCMRWEAMPDNENRTSRMS